MTRYYDLGADKLTRMARAIPEGAGSPPKNLTSKQKRICRHLAHAGLTISEIHAALGISMSVICLRRKLYAINIHPRNPSNLAHRGEETGLPQDRKYSIREAAE